MRWLTLFRLRNLARTAVRLAWMYLAAGIAMARPRPYYIDERQPGERNLPDAKRVAIYVHYDRPGRVHDYVFYYLECLRDVGFELVFVSNAPILRGEARDRVKDRKST